MKKVLFLMFFLICIFTNFLISEKEARLMRFPAVYENRVVFTYAGDLYIVDVSSGKGTARKITNHNGFEMFARFSPDGKWIAFTAQYDGNTEVYLMDANGGVPKRLTYTANLERDDVSDRMGPNNIVMGWKHDNKHIVFHSRMFENNPLNGRPFLTTVDGDLHRHLPFPRSGFCSFSPDDARLAYNRIFREFRTWKRYRGGMADDIWIYDFKTKTIKNITKHPALDIIPMWKDDNIYFLSDRDPYERMNLYVYNTKSSETRCLTGFKEFDIKFPSLGKDCIAFENGGYIYLFNTKTRELKKPVIYIREDRLHARGGIKNVKKNITNFEISPEGREALLGARGEIFTVTAKSGNTRNLTNSPGVHERNSRWSPDGQWIAFISDASGEHEIYIMTRDGGSKPIRLTTGADTYKFGFKWSPDSKKILWSDRKFRLRYLDIHKKKITDVVNGENWLFDVFSEGYPGFMHFDWSPDSRWIAYRKIENSGLKKIYLYSLETGQHHAVTDEWYSAGEPVFSPGGKYLFFVSDRDFNPTVGDIGLNIIIKDMARIYLVTLSKDTPSPFKPGSYEVKAVEIAKAPPVPRVEVDPEGLNNRIIGLPIKPAQYSSLVPVENKLYYLRESMTDSKRLLLMFDPESRKEIQCGEIKGFRISADFKKMLVLKDKSFAIIDLPSSRLEIKETLSLDDMDMELCLKSEWQNIFHECWRQMRDFFYVANMHGVDWEKMRKRYEPLLEHVNHRNDLTYIIGEMIGELNVGHAYIGGGERPEVKKIKTGLLGAELDRDSKTGYYRIVKILKGENWDEKMVSPLTVIGVNASEGDYIISIDGKSTSEMKNIYKALVNKVGKQVRLTLSAAPSLQGSREVVVVPIDNEARLYYYNWVQKNIETVNKATGGKVGYIHIPDMFLKGLVDFVKLYYPQLRKKALIIDARGNGGGYVSEWIIERLRREIAVFDVSRKSHSSVNPVGTMAGPKVCLTDEFAGSDGDFFPYRFKKHNIGKVIGKRTWGGAVTVMESMPLLDGGILYKPESGSYDTEGKEWIIEGHGVEPDIVVDNDPAKEFAGIDEQLNKAIEVILEELKTKEKHIPPPPPEPDKNVKIVKNT
jgi:tricorn protease